MYYDNNTIIYFNGQLIKAKEANLDLYSQSLHYGYSVFEGLRAYQGKIFKGIQHFNRLEASAGAVNLPYRWNTKVLIGITCELLKQNQLTDAYIRPLVYAPANMGFKKNTDSHLVIQCWKMEPFLGEQLLKVMTSSFQRPNPGGFKIHAKVSGHYVNSILASQEAKDLGFDEALLNDIHGYVAEAPGANIFYEKDGKLYTPPPGNILPGITRATIMELCEDLNIAVEEKLFTVKELKTADAAFFCGTAVEVIGLESIDNHVFKLNWEDTLSCKIQHAYKNLVIEKFEPQRLKDTKKHKELPKIPS